MARIIFADNLSSANPDTSFCRLVRGLIVPVTLDGFYHSVSSRSWIIVSGRGTNAVVDKAAGNNE